MQAVGWGEDERGSYALLARNEEHGKDLDAGGIEHLEQLTDTDHDIDPIQEKNLVQKLDRRIMPCLILMIVLNYLDRNALANARVQGIESTLNMKGSQFNTAISIFFIGYIGLQIPSNMILPHIKPSIYLPGCMIAWGFLSGCTAGVSSFKGLIVIRFLLGMVEAPFFPGALFLLSAWYTKRELALRTGLLYSGSLVAGAFGGLVGAGVESVLDGVLGWRSWQWLFILESSATVLSAAAAMCILPNYPQTTRWLDETERRLAISRLGLTASNGHGQRKSGLFHGLRMALTDYKLYLLSAIILMKTSAGAVTSFIPTLIATFNASRVATLLLVAPPYLCATIASVAVGYSSDKRSERSLHIILPISFGFVGFILFAISQSSSIHYISLFFMLSGVYGSYNVALAWISTTIPEPAEKRSAAIAVINVSGNIAQIYSPYLYLKGNGPRYTGAMLANCMFCLTCIGVVYWLRRCLKKENTKALEKAVHSSGGTSFGYIL